MGNRGNTLLQMFQWLIEQGNAEIVALCDLEESKVSKASTKLSEWQKLKPTTYSGHKDEWKKLEMVVSV